MNSLRKKLEIAGRMGVTDRKKKWRKGKEGRKRLQKMRVNLTKEVKTFTTKKLKKKKPLKEDTEKHMK